MLLVVSSDLLHLNMSAVAAVTNLILESATNTFSEFLSTTPHSNISISSNNSNDSLNSMSPTAAPSGPGAARPVMYRPPDLVSAQVANDVAEAVYCYILPGKLPRVRFSLKKISAVWNVNKISLLFNNQILKCEGLITGATVSWKICKISIQNVGKSV